ncbi:glycosyltransferase [Paeniglutamicibacter antarcticus]|uniref:Glycosyltransferase n=1 Tax=Arthrobacter terrae TaxID=2935737 RepID=A0A931CQJ7_9MICC|nr:glycosyltransferase [Arthrobacter terrae]MBG0739164.1 glycosyltransferase [Arthrobacter terrae]
MTHISNEVNLPGRLPVNPTEDIDYGSRMFTNSAARAAEIALLVRHTAPTQTKPVDVDPDGLLAGVTVVIPSFQGVDRIETCLGSLMDQELDPKRFEIILVINGPDDGTFELAQVLKARHLEHSLRVLFQAEAGAGAARNLGIAAARYSYLTFVDDDDYVGPLFLSALLNSAGPNCVAIAPIYNVDVEGLEDAENSLNKQILARAGNPFKLTAASSLVGFNACKLFPTAAILHTRYSEGLRSGEDICFMASVATAHAFDAVVSSKDRTGAYFRTLRDDSISRHPLDFDFAVQQRLDVIADLESLRPWDGSNNDALLTTLIRSQAGFIQRYLSDHTNERERIIGTIDASGIRNFPWPKINDNLAQDLVVSYCFAPYSDTSATVASKAIVERGKIVDVIYNNMNKVRRVDSNIETIAGRFIDKSFEIDAPASFAGWKQISEFVAKGISVADRQDARNGGYKSLYSRVLWTGSHFLAALFKLRHPAVKWTAEFSDPLSHDAKGERRKGDLVRDEMFEAFNRGIVSKGYASLATDNLFTWCEHITYVLADEIIFTNANQLEYMLSNISDKRLRRLVGEKAIVRVHPTPPPRSYHVMQSDYQLSSSVVNVGYFGAFYDNRGLMDVLTALVNAPVQVRQELRLHVFTNKAKDLSETVQRLGLTGIVKAQGYRPYLEFLNLSTRFDVLLVNDVERTGELPINPFLPSKYSDYLGSGRPIWGLVDEGSPLSSRQLEYRSMVGDSVSALRTIKSIHSDWYVERSSLGQLGCEAG